MNRIAPLILALLLLTTGPALAQRVSDSTSSPRTHNSASRPYYGGGNHTTPHGGHFDGETNSHHKGGHYTNPRSNNQYGVHKPR
jgi:hypothetical protein